MKIIKTITVLYITLFAFHSNSTEKMNAANNPLNHSIEYSITYPVGYSTQRSTENNFTPELVEYMSSTQIRHAKLWFAGLSKNWALANYELDKIEEELEAAVKYHPIFNKEVPLSSVMYQYLNKPMADLRVAIDNKGTSKFKVSFDALTFACNACHTSQNYGFIIIKRPTQAPLTNQSY